MTILALILLYTIVSLLILIYRMGAALSVAQRREKCRKQRKRPRKR